MGVGKLLSAGIAALLLAAGTLAAPALAKEAKPDIWERGCGDDDGNDRCSEMVQRKMRALYGFEPVAQLAKQGKNVRRAMIVDGYGRDLLAISFIRNAKGAAMVELRLPCAKSARCPPPLIASVSLEAWKSVVTIPDGLANGKPRSSNRGGDEIDICLHGWVVVAEAAGPGLKGGAVRATESACSDGPLVPYAFAMAEQALGQLPDCAVLKAGVFRNTPSLLASCANLRGNRRAAGEAYLIARDLDDLDTRGGKGIGGLLARAAQDKASAFDAALKGARFYTSDISASDQDHARITGTLHRRSEKIADESSAELQLDFIREDGRMVIAGYRLGDFKPVPQDD